MTSPSFLAAMSELSWWYTMVYPSFLEWCLQILLISPKFLWMTSPWQWLWRHGSHYASHLDLRMVTSRWTQGRSTGDPGRTGISILLKCSLVLQTRALSAFDTIWINMIFGYIWHLCFVSNSSVRHLTLRGFTIHCSPPVPLPWHVTSSEHHVIQLQVTSTKLQPHLQHARMALFPGWSGTGWDNTKSRLKCHGTLLCPTYAHKVRSDTAQTDLPLLLYHLQLRLQLPDRPVWELRNWDSSLSNKIALLS